MLTSKGGVMDGPVLVTYASSHGSTREVAGAVAGRLREHGLRAELVPAGDVRSLDGYDAVVLGAALYMGRLHADARRFLRRHHGELEQRTTAIFAMGPRTLSEKDVASARHQLDAGLAALPLLRPVEVAIFGGVVDPAQLRFPFSRMPASDARDWTEIEAWADRVAAALAAREPAAAG
jgi:menaquinone-dependent protoporphyrinogen oxidase